MPDSVKDAPGQPVPPHAATPENQTREKQAQELRRLKGYVTTLRLANDRHREVTRLAKQILEDCGTMICGELAGRLGAALDHLAALELDLAKKSEPRAGHYLDAT
jgi:hypothetical protein